MNWVKRLAVLKTVLAYEMKNKCYIIKNAQCYLFFSSIFFSCCTAWGSSYPYMYTFFQICSVATWVSRHSSQCYSAGSPCKSFASCIW